jgi:ABC-type polysaccharide/polyol phosphate export permease
VLVPVVAFTTVPVTPATLLVAPGLFLVLLNLTWMVLLLGTLGARFRDVPAIVASFTAALFIVTPVMWPITLLPEGRRWVAYANPFTYLIEVVRVPTLGLYPDINTWLICIGMAVLGWALAIATYARARTRLAYWL